MKKLNNQSEFDMMQNEYIINQGQVKSMLDKYIKQRNFAVVFAVVSLGISAGTVFFAMQIAGEAKKVDKVVFKGTVLWLLILKQWIELLQQANVDVNFFVNFC